jgi:hypothetical protein
LSSRGTAYRDTHESCCGASSRGFYTLPNNSPAAWLDPGMPVKRHCARAWLALPVFGMWLYDVHVAVLIGLVQTLSMRSEIDRRLPKAMETRSPSPAVHQDICHRICRTSAIRLSSDFTATVCGPFLSPRASRRLPSESDEASSAISAFAVQSPDCRVSVLPA